jgi:putative DNA primase/helicase
LPCKEIIMGKKLYFWPHELRARKKLRKTIRHKRAAKSKSHLVRLSKLPQQDMHWAWRKRIPTGMVTVFAGQQKSGKSLVACSIAATITRGGSFPCGEDTAKRGRVIIINSEDNPRTVLGPRLAAAGGNLNRIAIPKHRWPSDTARFAKRLEVEIKKLGRVRAVILDPITGVVSINRNNADQVRALLTALGALAARHDIAVIVVVHLNKSASAQAMARISGSFEWTAASRAAYLVVHNSRTGEHFFLPLANNIGLNSKGLAFRVKNKKAKDGDQALAAVWEDKPITTSADEALETCSTRHSAATSEAMEFLRQTIRRPISAQEIISLGANAGFSVKELRTARESLGIKPKRVGGVGSKGKWIWPPASSAGPKNGKSSSVAR